MIHLTERDYRMLGLISEQKFVTAEQLKHEYRGARMSEVYRRLGELERVGLIKSERLLTRNQKIYLVTRKYHGDGRDGSFGHLPYFSKPRVQHVEHDLRVTDVRLALQSLFANWIWIPERVFLAERSKLRGYKLPIRPVSDGKLEGPEGESLFVELENSNKAEERTRKTMQDWMNDEEASLVLYVATKDEVYRQLLRVLRSLSVWRDHDPVAIIRYETLVRGEPPYRMETYSGPKILRSVRNLNEGVETHANPNESV